MKSTIVAFLIVIFFIFRFETFQFNTAKKRYKMSQTEIGKPAPDFKGTAVVNGEFKEVSLSDYRGKYLVLFFYPLDL